MIILYIYFFSNKSIVITIYIYIYIKLKLVRHCVKFNQNFNFLFKTLFFF
jgi:hypothetical protein